MDSTYTSGLGASLVWLLLWESDRLTFGAGTSLCSHLISAVNLRSCGASRAGSLTQLSCRVPISRGSRSLRLARSAAGSQPPTMEHRAHSRRWASAQHEDPHSSFFLLRTQCLLAAHSRFGARKNRRRRLSTKLHRLTGPIQPACESVRSILD